MIGEDRDIKLGRGTICRCGDRKDARLLMCNDCMRAMMVKGDPEPGPLVYLRQENERIRNKAEMGARYES